MFFFDRIKNINTKDRVLEIGPGADPHPRSDILLELAYESTDEYHKQLGHSTPLVTDKKVVYYNGDKFPFADKSFDYVICAHVLEHVPDLPAFLSEVFRVGKRGYFEYPTLYYEYLYNIAAHQNVLKFENGELKYMKKSSLPFDSFKPVQEMLLQSLQRGHVHHINNLITYFIEGYEWDKSFSCKAVQSIDELTMKNISLPWPPTDKTPEYSTAFLIKQLIKKAIPNYKK